MIRRKTWMAAAAVVLAAAVFIQTGVPVRADDGFVSSTPDYNTGGTLTLEEQKEELREAMDTLASIGLSPMGIVARIRNKDKQSQDQAAATEMSAAGDQDTAEGQSPTQDQVSVEEASAEESADGQTSLQDSAVSMAKDVGSDMIDKAQETGNSIVNDAKEEVNRQKESFLQSLGENIKEAFGNFVDGLFAKL